MKRGRFVVGRNHNSRNIICKIILHQPWLVCCGRVDSFICHFAENRLHRDKFGNPPKKTA